MSIAYTLETAERDLRNVYWHIRASRQTNWKYVNKARVIMAAMKLMGVKKWELTNAMHCLKNFDCTRCGKNNEGIPCHRIQERRAAAAAKENAEMLPNI